MIRRPPRSTRTDTLLPYTTLFRSDRAARDATRDDAFINREMELTPEIVGRVSPYHSESGLHLVQALVETAAGNDAAAGHAVASFIRTIERPCLERDLTLRSEEHTSELQSLMRISYAVFCLTKKTSITHPERMN